VQVACNLLAEAHSKKTSRCGIYNLFPITLALAWTGGSQIPTPSQHRQCTLQSTCSATKWRGTVTYHTSRQFTPDPVYENISSFQYSRPFQVNLKMTLEFMHSRRYTCPGAYKQKGPGKLTFSELWHEGTTRRLSQM
jgi:hypothetical protein